MWVRLWCDKVESIPGKKKGCYEVTVLVPFLCFKWLLRNSVLKPKSTWHFTEFPQETLKASRTTLWKGDHSGALGFLIPELWWGMRWRAIGTDAQFLTELHLTMLSGQRSPRKPSMEMPYRRKRKEKACLLRSHWRQAWHTQGQHSLFFESCFPFSLTTYLYFSNSWSPRIREMVWFQTKANCFQVVFLVCLFPLFRSWLKFAVDGQKESNSLTDMLFDQLKLFHPQYTQTQRSIAHTLSCHGNY